MNWLTASSASRVSAIPAESLSDAQILVIFAVAALIAVALYDRFPGWR